MHRHRLGIIAAATAVSLLTLIPVQLAAAEAPAAAVASGHRGVAVGSQYDTTHVYIEPGEVGAFTASWEATFGGQHTNPVETTVTPTPSRSISQLIFSPVGNLSVFDFTTPIPAPFGIERTGWLVTDMDQGVREALKAGADVVVSPFADPIGKDAVVAFPGGVHTQLYWHTTPPSYAPLASVPENRLYVSRYALAGFLRSYLAFTRGHVTSDDQRADGAAVGLPGTVYHRVTLESPFGKSVVTVSDGNLPYPFGREVTGYQVTDLNPVLDRARAAGATVLSGPVAAGGRHTAVLRFPGGYVAEVHDGTR